ncbi:MAG: hypothetical protein ACP5ON_03060, partial [Bacteroidota bacterium]
LGEVQPDAYEYIPGECYPWRSYNRDTFIKYVPVPGKQIFMLGSTSTAYSTYVAARDTYGISGVVCWGDAWEGTTLEQVVQIFGADNVIYALYNSSQGVEHAYALGIRKFWFEEPLHDTDLVLQYTNARLLAYDRSRFPNSVIYTADWSDVGACGLGAYDCYDDLYNEYVLPWSYQYGVPMYISSDQYWGGYSYQHYGFGAKFKDHIDYVYHLPNGGHFLTFSINDGPENGYNFEWASADFPVPLVFMWTDYPPNYTAPLAWHENAFQNGWLCKVVDRYVWTEWRIYLGGDPNVPEAWGRTCKMTRVHLGWIKLCN